MSVTEVTSLQQFQEIIARDELSVFDFWATWCGPCKAISPIFANMAAAGAEEGLQSKDGGEPVKFKAYKVDVDAVPDVSQYVGIRAMPTFIAYTKGEKVGTVIGARVQELQNLIVGKAAQK
ncbi:related to thioredoxin, putative-Aspergillus flavus [Serendipita indica DSM 11827]|uniref:Thioredoxin n=1 Tax=Serendipita indica (strain DSM 11827) TaxID=1109443 RepID=G4T9E3_SERID|nr:related to thioredoxin, putative-Aspergillus flavus [Serendipita indica DSM 11827]